MVDGANRWSAQPQEVTRLLNGLYYSVAQFGMTASPGGTGYSALTPYLLILDITMVVSSLVVDHS